MRENVGAFFTRYIEAEPPFGIVNISAGRMVDAVILRLGRYLFVIERFKFCGGFLCSFDVARQAKECGIKAGDVSLEELGGVVLGIYGYK